VASSHCRQTCCSWPIVLPSVTSRVGQNLIYTVYIRYCLQGFHQLYGYIQYIYIYIYGSGHPSREHPYLFKLRCFICSFRFCVSLQIPGPFHQSSCLLSARSQSQSATFQRQGCVLGNCLRTHHNPLCVPSNTLVLPRRRG